MSQTDQPSFLAGKKILVVDDDPLVSQLLAKVMLRDGAELSTASNGAEALEFLTEQPCDLAVIDLIMPEVDGLRLIDVLRQMPKTENLPIVVITTRRDQAAIEDAKRLGVDLFIQKPIKWAHISQQLSDVLAEKYSTAESSVA